jgi:hypothetical protein
LNELGKYLRFYIGCNTSEGILLGIRKDILFIQSDQASIEEHSINEVGNILFLHLQELSDLTPEQKKQLIKEGLVIGRPYGYTFTSQAFLYLFSLSVDLFGLINAGYAKDLKQM